MQNAKQQLGNLIRAQREHKDLSQEALAKLLTGINRSNIAHLEQGLRIPKAEILKRICEQLDIPKIHWEAFLDADIQSRLDFEEQLTELTGMPVTLDGHDRTSYRVANDFIKKLLGSAHSESQARDLFNSILVFYGVQPTSKAFFERYLGAQKLGSFATLSDAIERYQGDAVRLYSTLAEAYQKLNSATDLNSLLSVIRPNETIEYGERAVWQIPNDIEEARLADLDYISSARVRKESDERATLKTFLLKLAADFRNMPPANAISAVAEKTKRRMDSLLRKFNSHFEHGLFSPLFAPDADEVEREAERIAPKSEDELLKMETTQRQAMENLSFYLASDFIDVYVATSMRSDADFVSVNAFTHRLFEHDAVKPLKLRYFNPTQSWIDDRIAKGLVEALMLRRASVTIYMAQKTDTFGKDSEASVALGQGKPVIVYVPRLSFPDGTLDTEQLFKRSRTELLALLTTSEQEDIDDDSDEQALFGKILSSRLLALDELALAQIAKDHWADFDLIEEQHRVPEALREVYRKWINAAILNPESAPSIGEVKPNFVGILTANAITFERRAKLFREIHPLALQVILSTGVLNGILVVRTGDQCGEILSRLIKNQLDLDLHKDEFNYRLVERITSSTIRVISRHRLLLNAFATYYSRLN